MRHVDKTMKWTTSARKMTIQKWRSLSPYERYLATRFWITQNRRLGGMPKRAAVKRMRRILRQSRINLPPITSFSKMQLLSFEYKQDDLLDRFFKKRKSAWRVAGKRKDSLPSDLIRAFPVEDFSLMSDPKLVFQTLTWLCQLEAIAPPMNIDFPDDRVRDIGAYLLFSILYQRMAPFATGGEMSEKIIKVMKAVNLTKAMGMRVATVDSDDVFPLPLESHSRAHMVSETTGGEQSRKEKVSTRVREKVADWLTRVGVTLPENALNPLAKMIGEMLDNAERHAQDDGKSKDAGGWWITGFMAKRKNLDGNDRFVCHLAIVGLGRTISETLMQSDPENPRFHPQDADYAKSGGKALTPEQRAMVLSLQNGITSSMDSSGGLGMGELLTTVADLGDGVGKTNTCIAIVSGQTCLCIQRHHMIQRTGGEFGRQFWLNSNNDGAHPPDAETVVDIGLNFPGTCISIRFELDPEHFSAAERAGYEDLFLNYSLDSVIWKGM